MVTKAGKGKKELQVPAVDLVNKDLLVQLAPQVLKGKEETLEQLD